MAIQLFNARRNQMDAAEVTKEKGGLVAVFTWSEGEETKQHFVKLPAENTQTWIDNFNATNVPVVTAEEEEAGNAELDAIIETLR